MHDKNNTMTIVNATMENAGRYTFEAQQRHQLVKTRTFVKVEGKGR